MPSKARRIKQELKELRATCIENQSDPVLRRIAYAMEEAIRYATEPVVGWPTLTASALDLSALLRKELQS